MGYNLINPKRVSNYKVIIDLMQCSNTGTSKDIVIAVKVVSRGYRELIVGLFYTYGDASSFINEFYPGNLVTRIVYANNELTKNYLNGLN